jgi:hypothetical protein
MVKAKAQFYFEKQPVSQAGKFMPYFTAERKASLDVQKAVMDKDFVAATEAKQRQMLNHALAIQGVKFKDELAVMNRFFSRYGDRGQDLKSMEYGFIRQIDGLLIPRGLALERPEDAATYQVIAVKMKGDGIDPSEIAHKTGMVEGATGEWHFESLREFVSRIQEDCRNIWLPESVYNDRPGDFKNMSVSDARDLKRAVFTIKEIGRAYDTFLDETIKGSIQKNAQDFAEQAKENVGEKYSEYRKIGSPAQTRLEKQCQRISRIPDKTMPLVTLLSICEFIDAKDPNGLAKHLIYRPLKRGEDGEIQMNDQATVDVTKIVDQQFGKGEFSDLKKTSIYIKSLDRNLTMDEILACGLNQGTEKNLQRLRDGYGLSDKHMTEILSNLGKNHWDFCQSVWDYLETYWPHIVAQQQKVGGETPEKVESRTVQTPFGEYRGGYYPLDYDYAKSNEAMRTIEQRNALFKTEGAVAAHTDHGFTESRVYKLFRPVRLDTSVLFTHLQNVIHDLNLRQPVIDVSRFLRQKEVKDSIINAMGLDGYRTIENHVRWVASDQGEYLTALDKAVRYLRFGATMATLGFRPITAPIFLGSNVINSLQDVGPVNFGNMMKDFLANRDANVDFVDLNSTRMNHRSTMRDRDLKDMAKRMRDDSFYGRTAHFMFWFHAKADQAISYPLWLHTYKSNITEFGQQKAVDIADEAVTKLAGSGSILDQASIQRGSEMQKVATWWYTWAGNMFNRAWREGKIAGLEYDKGNVGTAIAIVAQAGVYGWLLQGANEVLWREFFRNTSGVNEDKQKKRVIHRMVMQGVSYIPVARELADYSVSKLLHQRSEPILPFQDAVKSLADPFIDLADTELQGKQFHEAMLEDFARGTAVGLRYPQTLNTMAFNFIDYLNGNGELTWRDLLTRRTKG